MEEGMDMYKQIFVAVDGSEPSTKALKKAGHLAIQYDVPLVIINVIDTRSVSWSNIDVSHLWEEMKKEAEQLLEKCKKDAKTIGVIDVKTKLLYGNPRVEIPKKINSETSKSLVVLGGSGRNAVERMFIGSVTEASVRRVTNDVLIIKSEKDTLTYRHILVAVDGSEQAEQALVQAIELANVYGAQLTITHVVEQVQKTEEHDESEVQKEKAMLHHYKQTAENNGVKAVQTILHFGNPRKELPLKLTVEQNIDLLMTGATGRGAVERIFTGSVAHASLHHAPCDVLIVRYEN